MPIKGGGTTNRYQFRAHRTSGQSINSGAWTKVEFNVEDFDIAGKYDHVTNYRYLPAEIGYYHVMSGVSIRAIDDTKQMATRFYRNGAWEATTGQILSSEPNADLLICGSCLIYLSAITDFIEVYVYHNNGGALNTGDSRAWLWFAGYKVGF